MCADVSVISCVCVLYSKLDIENNRNISITVLEIWIATVTPTEKTTNTSFSITTISQNSFYRNPELLYSIFIGATVLVLGGLKSAVFFKEFD